jgi:hypothetical protein
MYEEKIYPVKAIKLLLVEREKDGGDLLCEGYIAIVTKGIWQ